MAIVEKVPKTKHDDLLFTLDELMIMFEPTDYETANNSLMKVLNEINAVRRVQNMDVITRDFKKSYESEASKVNAGMSSKLLQSADLIIEDTSFNKGNVMSFGVNAANLYRIVFLDLDSDNPDDKATILDKQNLVRILKRIYEQIKPENNPYSGIVSISPNWLLSASNGGSGTGGGGVGGPGTRPVAYESTGGKPPYQFRFFKLIEDGKDTEGTLYKNNVIPLDNWGENVATTAPMVKVAILDTFPTEAQLQELADNELWTKLRPLKLKQNADLELDEVSEYKVKSPRGHNYNMASHGLFIAGIIRSIAEKADIRVYRVLDNKGVGTLRSILWGLQQVLVDYPDDNSPLIVNMSLTMNFLYSNGKRSLLGYKVAKLFEEENWSNVIKEAKNELTEREKQNHDARENLTIPKEEFDSQLAFLRNALTLAIKELKQRRNTVIVAAAGNEGDKNNRNPKALYPAAYYDVVGVGSLNKWKKNDRNKVFLSQYSCLADAPPSRGFAVYGGNSEDFSSRLTANGPIADEKDGLLGLWVGDLPTPAAENGNRKKGWARWSGTSFATPIIVGALAMLIEKKKAANTDAALEKLQGMWEELVSEGNEFVPHVVLAEQFSPENDESNESNEASA
jgi:hypothetical protein